MPHTPGPWKVVTEHVEECGLEYDRYHVDRDGHWIASVDPQDTALGKHHANARLIAAAPDLLAAAEALVAWAEGPPSIEASLKRRLDKLRAAIARARGEE